jgi:GR25 family glycosyltransferase involved in LPS biosynthesis
MNSILNQWTDVNMIDYWFCVDDNSSDEDRNYMRETYGWIDYYMKTPEEKGHRNSMNIIWNKLNELKPTYWIHLEDDFLFYTKKNYVTDAIHGLDILQDKNVKQIVFNRNYGETIDGYDIVSHTFIEGAPDYVLHNHILNKTFNYRNCHYWPNYSFRPSMVLVEPILKLGNYDSTNQFFERDYANRWTAAGYKTAFFNSITSKHIGRLTSQRNNTNIVNAYNLNNENQFNKSIGVTTYKSQIKIVNLERRADRKLTMTQLLDNNNIQNYAFIKAIDGKKIKPCKELKDLFNGNDFGSRSGVIGCALTHYQLWVRLLLDTTTDYYVVLEDDILDVANNLNKKISDLALDFKSKDVVFFGYSMFQNKRELVKDIYNNNNDSVSVVPLNKSLYIGGTFGYSINKTGAKKLIDYIGINGIKHGIDYIMKITNNLNSYECQPQLVFTDWNEGGKPVDSDIQNIYDKMDFSQIIDIENTIHEDQGVIINEPIIRCKMLCNWTTSEKLCKEWSNMCDNIDLFRWKNIQMTWSDNIAEIDYYIIINKPPNNVYFDPKRTIVFQMEPWVNDVNATWGVKTWGKWSIPDPLQFLAVRGRKTHHHNNAFWQLELSLSQLQNITIEKTHCISSICSSKYFDEGHIKRIDLLKFIETKNDLIIDIYNTDNKFEFKNYKGPVVPYVNKSKGMIQYKYYFMIENNYEPNFITEKIWEPILCESLVFYYGCPNITDHINSSAFVLLDINDFEKSYQIIKTAIDEDWWSQRIDIIRKEKTRILNELAFFPVISKIISNQ